MSESEPRGERSPDAVVAALAKGTIHLRARVPWASNVVLVVEVESRGVESDGGDGMIPALYKPAAGEQPLWDFPSGTLHRREVAAWELSRAAGWNLVPPTVLRLDGPLGEGSLQQWIRNDPEITAFELLAASHPALPRLALFDAVINNADRKASHCLLDHQGEVWGIDHGLAFHALPKLRTVLWNWAGEAIPQELRPYLVATAAVLRDEGTRAALTPLLDAAELLAMQDRIDHLLRSDHFPHPTSQRAVPWPPL